MKIKGTAISLHTNDWCHICGKRVPFLLDINYPENAEHPKKNQEEYLRICSSCINKLKLIMKEEIVIGI